MVYDNIITQKERSVIVALCVKYGIKNYTINADGLVDVEGGVRLYNLPIPTLPLRFGKVTGDFICSNNRLTSLNGCPTYVGGDFDCVYNRLISLEYCPKTVVGSFYCNINSLASLEFSPLEVGGIFNCSDNYLDSFVGCYTKFSDSFPVGKFICYENKKLTKFSYYHLFYIGLCPDDIVSYVTDFSNYHGVYNNSYNDEVSIAYRQWGIDAIIND